jgi:hypothetical protein
MFYFAIFMVIVVVLSLVTIAMITKINHVSLPKKWTKIVIFAARFFQVMIMLYVVLSFYQISYFFFNEGEIPIVLKGILNVNKGIQSVFDWGLPILILFGVFNNLVIFFMLELMALLLKDFLNQVMFNQLTNKRLLMLAHLFLIRLFCSFIINYLQSGTLSFNLEYLLFYGLMMILISVFNQASLLQEDSDLAI